MEILKKSCELCYSLKGASAYSEENKLKNRSRMKAVETAERLEIKEFSLYCGLNCEKARKSIGL